MLIQVLGANCSRCERLAAKVQLAAEELALDFTFEKIGDIERILSFGVPVTPALIVDGAVVCYGTVPPLDEIKTYLTKAEKEQ
ncbi:MAG: thioredoxin family protein [Planctomycetaceae bacterium]|jgi:small redox-active disulfide protein 2|nr:thioredoxin family protein [Planctomycetaceae bacterium]